MQGGREGPSHSKQDGGCVFPAFVQVAQAHGHQARVLTAWCVVIHQHRQTSSVCSQYRYEQCGHSGELGQGWGLVTQCSSCGL